MEKTVEIMTFVAAGINPKNGGVKGTDGVWYNLSKFNKELSPGQFSLGNEYKVEVQKGKGGALYIQKLVSEAKKEPVKTETTKTEAQASNYDKRNVEIGLRGFLQAAVVAASHFTVTKADLEANVRDVLAVMDKLLAERMK